MSVNSKMTAIADKIRTLRGISGTMGLDTMATHIGNEQTAITAALAALVEKGVDVPAGSTSDALAGLIGAIESGGGDGGKFTSGIIIPSEDCGYLTITHELGIVPKFALLMPETTLNASGMGTVYYTYSLNGEYTRRAQYNGSSTNIMRYSLDLTNTYAHSYMYGALYKANANTLQCGADGVTTGFFSGKRYVWIVGG